MKFTVKETPYIRYQQTTYEGTFDFEGEEVTFRFSEDDNGSEFYILEEDGFNQSDFEDPKHIAIYAAIMEYGNPEHLEEGEEIELDEETLAMYS